MTKTLLAFLLLLFCTSQCYAQDMEDYEDDIQQELENDIGDPNADPPDIDDLHSTALEVVAQMGSLKREFESIYNYYIRCRAVWNGLTSPDNGEQMVAENEMKKAVEDANGQAHYARNATKQFMEYSQEFDDAGGSIYVSMSDAAWYIWRDTGDAAAAAGLFGQAINIGNNIVSAWQKALHAIDIAIEYLLWLIEEKGGTIP